MLTQEEIDLIFQRAVRPHFGEEWHLAKPKILASLPDEVNPDMLDRYVDDSENPSVSINKYGVEPRFFAHRTSKRLLEFYRSL